MVRKLDPSLDLTRHSLWRVFGVGRPIEACASILHPGRCSGDLGLRRSLANRPLNGHSMTGHRMTVTRPVPRQSQVGARYTRAARLSGVFMRFLFKGV